MTVVRVLIAAPPMNRGGAERQLIYLARELPKHDVELAFALLAPDGPLEAELTATGARILKPQRRLPRPWRTWVQAQLIAREIRNWRPQIVHSFLSEPHFAAALGRALAGTPHPLLVHGRRSTRFYAATRPVGAWLERKLHGACSALVGNSTALARELSAESGTPEKVAVIHNGAPLTELDAARPSRTAARASLGIGPNAFVIAVVANLYAYKRHADVLSALAQIKDQLPQDWVILLAGRDAGEREKLEQQVGKSGLSAHVRFLGEVEDTAPVHAAADLEVLVSIQEGFSNALLEAMAAGVPAIVSDSGGNPDVVVHEQTGLIVSAGAPDALGAAILKLANAPDLRRRYGEAARARAAQSFTIEASAARYAELWRGLALHPERPFASWFRGPGI